MPNLRTLCGCPEADSERLSDLYKVTQPFGGALTASSTELSRKKATQPCGGGWAEEGKGDTSYLRMGCAVWSISRSLWLWGGSWRGNAGSTLASSSHSRQKRREGKWVHILDLVKLGFIHSFPCMCARKRAHTLTQSSTMGQALCQVSKIQTNIWPSPCP